MRYGQSERLRQLPDRLQQPVPAVLLGQDVLLGGGQEREALGRCAGDPGRPVEAVEQARAHLVLGQHQRHGKPPADALVFPDIDGGPLDPDELSKRWKRACKNLSLPPVTFHALRHAHASALIAAKEDIVKISWRLGHSSPTVTLSVYAHLFEQDDSSAALAIGRVLG